MLDNAVHNTDFRNYFTSDTTKDSQFLSNFCKKFSDMAIFSDSSEEFSQFPDWVNFLISLGFRWPSGETRKRRIALISMPCDSPAAGLISLGALIRDLENPKANAFDGHVVSIRHYAEQYLDYCKDCQITPCNPELKNCGYVKESTGQLKHNNKKKYRISERTRLKTNQNPETSKQFLEFHTDNSWLYVEQKNHPVPIESFEERDTHWSLKKKCILNWHIHDEPPTYIDTTEGEDLSERVYTQIIKDGNIFQDNLKRSFSGLCLAGRSAGEAKIKELCETIKIGDSRLSELLTIQNWSSSNPISRITFFNSRTEKPDRRVNNTSLVVADGDDCFLKILRRSEFQSSDIVGVIHRTTSREKLEEVGNKLSELKQWYRNDTEILEIFESVPYGISINIQEKIH